MIIFVIQLLITTSGQGCAAGTLEPLAYSPELVQLNFALY